MKQGRFVTFEGIEGCGKSTQAQLLAAWMARRGISHFVTREPGGTPAGIRIREILLSEKTESLAPKAEALLYLADRLQHVAQVIRPHLDAGEVVICDRFHDSTIAYQGYARGLSLDWLESVWRGSGLSVVPDLTILLDVAPEIGIKRSLQKLQKQKLDESRFEQEKLEFHERVRVGFQTLALLNSSRYVVLDGNGTEESIHHQILDIFEAFLKGKERA